MGYTHYWKKKAPYNENKWAGQFIPEAQKILSKAISDGIPLAYEYDKTGIPATCSGGQVRFNGWNDDGHETFAITVDDSSFEFCKTAEKPYDTVVTAILALAKDCFGDAIDVTSDGEADDWHDGIDLACAATGRKIKLPSGVE